MAISFTCPNCERSYTLSDSLEGKRIRCKECDEVVLVRRAVASSKRAVSPVAPEDDRVETAAGRKGPLGRRRIAENEESTPSRSRRGRDEEDDWPERGRKGRKVESSTLLLVVGLCVAGGVLLLGVVGLTVWFLLNGSKNQPIASSTPSPSQSESKPQSQPRPEAQPRPAPRPEPGAGPPEAKPGLIKPTTFQVPVEYQNGMTERVLLGGPGGQRAGICSQGMDGKTYVFECFDIPGRKRLSRTELTGVAVPQQMSLSPDGSLLAVAELVSGRGFESAITIWSLADGKVLTSRWKPYPAPNPSAVLSKLTFLDANRLLTISTNKQITLWNLSGQPTYAIEHKIPGLFSTLLEDPYTKQPGNFALSPDRGSIALFNGVGFEVLETSTGKIRVRTGNFVGQGSSLKGVALNSDASRLAVYLWVPAGPQKLEDYLVIWDLKTNQQIGNFPIRVQKQNTSGMFSYGGNALSWWGDDHLLLWGGNGNALVVKATTGQPLRELEGPFYGRFGFDDPDGRLWYDTSLKGQAKAFLCAVDFPEEEVQKNQDLDGPYYKLWWLTENGVSAQAAADDVRVKIIKRAGPAK